MGSQQSFPPFNAPIAGNLQPATVWLNFFRQLARSVIGGSTLPVYANNAAAVAGKLAVGQFYRSGADPDVVSVVH